MNIKRKEIQGILAGLSLVKGFKDYKKAISLGRDIRVLKRWYDETESAIKACKPDNYDDLSNELKELKQKKATQFKLADSELINDNIIGMHVLLTWDKASEWERVYHKYNEAIGNILNTEIEIEMHTELTETDIPVSVEDLKVAEALSYFMKE